MAVSTPAPRVWLLLGDKGGDNAQLRVLAGALGWPFVEKPLVFNRLYRLPNIALGASLASLRAGVAPPAPPWPDLILSSGRRTVPVAQWIRRQNGGRTCLVHVGRPWAPAHWFDLVVAMPQYDVPVAANVFQANLPLNRIEPQRLAAEAARWQPRLAHLPRPYLAVLLGGPTKPLRFGLAEGAAIGRGVDALARSLGGTVLAVTARRTPPGLAQAFTAALTVPNVVHEWRAGDDDNPYAAFLGLADRIVVSGDSASMLAEACHTGRPVIAAPLPYDDAPRPSLTRQLDRAMPGALRRLLRNVGIYLIGRDMNRLLRAFTAAGHIGRLDAPQAPTVPVPNDLPPLVGRIKALLRRRADQDGPIRIA
jgi:mitochondrial fission protein ELM1